MRRVVYAAISVLLAMALPSCMQPPTSGGLTAPVGYGAATPAQMIYTPHPAPPPLKDATVNQSQSQALTDYLKTHRLPLVGAQVLVAPDGERQVILFGYVATGYGKQDAENKAHAYMKSAAVTVDNRITIQPELANANAAPPAGRSGNGYGSGSSSAQSAYDPSLGNAQQYQQQSAQDPYSNYQSYQSQSSSPGMLSTLGPLLGMFGGSFGGGGMGMGMGMGGGSFGGFGTGYGNYGGMGYPSYPPSPGFGPAPPYPPYP
ncbi:MAG: hypothetical protein ACYDC3_18495 [Candidatus Binataceae bacterium]